MSAVPQQATAPGAPRIAVRDLRIWYGTGGAPVRAVDGVDLTINAGQTVALVGESGCGKTTLGRGILGMLPPSAAVDGEVVVDGVDLAHLPPRRLRAMRGLRIGLVFQEPMTRLDPLMRIGDHFDEVLRTHRPKMSRAERERESVAMLRSLGIPPSRIRQYPHEFSGGMRQRIMIGLALVLRPAVIVADEPTTALDVLVEAQIVEILAELRRNADCGLLLITHNLGIVAKAADRVAVMYAGHIVEEGEVDRVFSEPAHPYTRELLRSTISLDTSDLHYIPGSPPDLSAPLSGCLFHPRCPDAMRVCQSRDPGQTATAGGGRVSCWLHRLDELEPADREPLPDREISVADEA
ncbi:ABC transporter ATP-binding protein [Rugosimonospora acidiphila]|uniref:ABC transporter ATP-binding protein n=1 Tax=Rugosimonospora acidiphila TaxID=556531 RepID=A0ABP9SMP0_9ACTN